MKTLIAILAVLTGWAGVLSAKNDDENGALVDSYSRRVAVYDGNDLSCYSSTARVKLDDGFVRHWLKLERSLTIPYYVDVNNIACNDQPVPGVFRLGGNNPVVYVYFDDEIPTAKWHFETEVKK